MNKQIQELFLKANEWALHNYPPPFNPFEWENLRNNKFAHLIVSECMDIIYDESEKVSDEWQCEDGNHIWWKIKEHFGVES